MEIPRTDAYVTVTGRRGFATAPRRALVDGQRISPRPAVVSARGHLREGLPTVYKEQDFAARFVGALEGLLDPVVAILDALPAYVDPDLAPTDMLELLAAWVGLQLDESWPEERRRELIRQNPELARRRGTRIGLELLLKVAFPDLPLRVEEKGGVAWGGASLSPGGGSEGFVVYCDVPIDEERQAAVARTIEYGKPAHVSYRLRVRAKQPREK